eukprot:scaffold76744_cov67-Phaeocystis_antarctica.AAC.7
MVHAPARGGKTPRTAQAACRRPATALGPGRYAASAHRRAAPRAERLEARWRAWARWVSPMALRGLPARDLLPAEEVW